MTPFQLQPDMLTMRGVFYPTGYMFLMFPTLEDAQEAERKLRDDGLDEGDVTLLAPDVVLEQIARTVGNADAPLPSAGTEGDTVRQYAELASHGHHALMIHAPEREETDHVMEVLRDARISYAQKYRTLVIEDLGT